MTRKICFAGERRTHPTGPALPYQSSCWLPPGSHPNDRQVAAGIVKATTHFAVVSEAHKPDSYTWLFPLMVVLDAVAC